MGEFDDDADLTPADGAQPAATRNGAAARAAVGGTDPAPFTSAELGALAHLYRGEVYRSTLWRTRLDATTNWSVVTLGVAMSISYSSPTASPLPLLLAGMFITLFLYLEGRRYRYFNVWRARARWLERHFYAPLLRRETYCAPDDWRDELAEDYLRPDYHISAVRALGRRLRRNYIWIFSIQGLAYFGKIIIHPTPVPSAATFFERMAVGPAPGVVVFILGLGFQAGWVILTLSTWFSDRRRHGRPPPVVDEAAAETEPDNKAYMA
ncbi:MAG: DUF2270 domain-containing protein [Pseudomonadota bacterium]